jgi:hypothetical protein
MENSDQRYKTNMDVSFLLEASLSIVDKSTK